MPDETVLGVNGFTEQPIEREKNSGTPWKTRRKFAGPQALADAKEDELLLTYAPMSLRTIKGVPCIIEIETEEAGGTAAVSDQTSIAETLWELSWDRMERDIRSHGYFRTSGVSTEYMERIDQAIKKGIAALSDWDTLSGIGHMNDYMNCRLQGIDSYVSYYPILRANVTTTRTTNINMPARHTTQVIAWSSIQLPFGSGTGTTPSGAKIDQPSIYRYKSTIDDVLGEAGWGEFAVNQWMIGPSNLRVIRSTKRREYTFEWTGADRWTGCLYNGGTGHPVSA